MPDSNSHDGDKRSAVNKASEQIRDILRRIGVDRAVFYSILGRFIQAAGGLVTLLFIVKYLSPMAQGYYYTFGSVVALQIFFELGLNNVVSQFGAAEKATLTEDRQRLLGDSRRISRLSSLLHFGLKTNAVLAVALLGLLITAGMVFFGTFGKGAQEVEWQTPFVVMCISSSLQFLIAPVVALIEGLGNVAYVARVRAVVFAAVVLSNWVFLSVGAGLFVLGLSGLVGVFLTVVLLSPKFAPQLVWLWHQQADSRVSYWREIYPYQWKIALSWITGYLLFQLFNPVIFAANGPKTAGQLGMTLTVLNSILTVSVSLISTKVPLYCGLIAQQRWAELDQNFSRARAQSVLFNIVLLGMFFGLLAVFDFFNFTWSGTLFRDRFLPYPPMLLLALAIAINNLVAANATYLRCHNKEPMLANSLILGVLVATSTILLGSNFGVVGLTAGYASLLAMNLPWTFAIFVSSRKKWHAN